MTQYAYADIRGRLIKMKTSASDQSRDLLAVEGELVAALAETAESGRGFL
jgi:hypothetical protein